MPFPHWVEKDKDGEKTWDVYSRMLKDRIIFLTGPVDDDMANHLVAQMLLLESQDDKSPITMYVNSPGGSVVHGMAIYDTMQYLNSPIHTVVIGHAASMGSFLAQAGEPGHRYVLPYSRTMIHRVSSGTTGTSGSIHVQELEFEDAKRHLDESKRLNEELTKLYVHHNSAGKTYEELYEEMKFDTFLSAQDAVDYGLADAIVRKKNES